VLHGGERFGRGRGGGNPMKKRAPSSKPGRERISARLGQAWSQAEIFSPDGEGAGERSEWVDECRIGSFRLPKRENGKADFSWLATGDPC